MVKYNFEDSYHISFLASAIAGNAGIGAVVISDSPIGATFQIFRNHKDAIEWAQEQDPETVSDITVLSTSRSSVFNLYESDRI